jgi:hypothetical protein
MQEIFMLYSKIVIILTAEQNMICASLTEVITLQLVWLVPYHRPFLPEPAVPVCCSFLLPAAVPQLVMAMLPPSSRMQPLPPGPLVARP